MPFRSEPEISQFPHKELCTRSPTDERRLERLRADPVANQIERFARELVCERLRAQVQRFVSWADMPKLIRTLFAPRSVSPEFENIGRTAEARVDRETIQPHTGKAGEDSRFRKAI
jgi:hypothetical protein